jgi:hypothetical protein
MSRMEEDIQSRVSITIMQAGMGSRLPLDSAKIRFLHKMAGEALQSPENR